MEHARFSAATDRDVWFLEKANELLGRLPDNTNALLSRINCQIGSSQIERALVVLYTCNLYRAGWSPDRLAKHWTVCELFGDATQTEVLHNVVVPARLLFLFCGLPFHRYWRVDAFASDFLIYRCARYMGAGVSRQVLVDDLRTKWAFETAEGAGAVLDEAALITNSSVAFELCLPGDPLASIIADLSNHETVKEAVEMSVKGLRVELRERGDIEELARAFHTALLIYQDAGKLCGEPILARKVRETLLDVPDLFRHRLGSLLPGEVDLLHSPESQILLLEECIRLTPVTKSGVDGPVGPLPDLLNDEFSSPEWVVDMAYSHGGRFSHNSVGPVPYLVVVFEPSELGTGRELRLVKPEISEESLMLCYQLVDVSDDPLNIGFSFSLSNPTHVRTLALMGVTGSWRIDLLTTKSDGRFEVLKSAVHESPSVRKQLLDVAENAVRRHFGGNPMGFLEAFQKEMAEDSAEVAFDMIEHGKAEELHDLGSTIPEVFLTGPACVYWQQYADVRREVLRHHEDRVRALDSQDTTAAEAYSRKAESSETRRKFVRQQLRGRAIHEAAAFFDVPHSVDALGDVCPPGRCFIHFSFNRRRLVAFWAMVLDGCPRYGQIEFPDFDVENAISSTNSWLATESLHDPMGRRSALSEVIGIASASIGTAISSNLVSLGARHLIISPTWFLDLWPLHCAEGVDSAGQKGLLFDIFESITYAPSFRALVDGIRRNPGGRLGIAAVGYSPPEAPLPYVERELETLGQMFPGTTLLVDHNATPITILGIGETASVIHIACHGDWHVGDTLRSGLLLRGSQGRLEKLYAPKILADGRFDGVDLIVLSACSSGRNLQTSRTFQEYRGLDGAFLTRGAAAVVSSLWEIDDFGAFLVMTGFYDGLGTGMTTEAALKHSVGRLRNASWVDELSKPGRRAVFDTLYPGWEETVDAGKDRLSHPYYWGAFKSSGVSWKPPGLPHSKSARVPESTKE